MSKVDVFNNQNVNFILNKIYEFLEKKISDAREKLVLTGRAAAILQGEKVNTPEQVVLMTNDSDLYSIVISDLEGVLDLKGVLKFQNRCLFYFPDFFLEIWKSEDSLDVIRIDTIYCQTFATIPEILL